MKKVVYIFLLLGCMSFLASCEDEDAINQPQFEEAPQIIPLVNQSANRFNAANNWSGTLSFTVDFDSRGVDIDKVEVYKTFTRTGTGSGTSARVLHQTFDSWPFTVNVTAEQAVAGITFAGSPLTLARLNPAKPNPTTGIVTAPDNIVFTFEIVRKDGRRIIYTPLSTAGVASGAMFQRPFAVWAPVVEVP